MSLGIGVLGAGALLLRVCAPTHPPLCSVELCESKPAARLLTLTTGLPRFLVFELLAPALVLAATGFGTQSETLWLGPWARIGKLRQSTKIHFAGMAFIDCHPINLQFGRGLLNKPEGNKVNYGQLWIAFESNPRDRYWLAILRQAWKTFRVGECA